MEVLYMVLAFVGGFVLSLLVVRLAGLGRSAAAEKAAAQEAKKVLDAAEAEAEEVKKAATVEGKELARKIKADAETEIRERRAEVAKEHEALGQREAEIDRRNRKAEKLDKELERRERSIEGREKAADAMARKAEEAQEQAKRRLERVAGLSADEARRQLEQEMMEEARAQVADEIKKIEDEAASQAEEKSKHILATAIQRNASEFVGERTVSVVPLPSDDMKGRLIGREGRNIRALEAAAGIDLIIDDTSEVITVSCFNPVRREIARRAITKLVADGRIHPTRIEEVVAKAEREVDGICKEAGEQAVFDLGLHRVHPELIRMLGRLKYRSSFAQNVLQHSIEVGFIAGMLASELGLSVKQARRAGLLHDIGKAVDHEQEGSHAEVGARIARKHGESPRVCDAIARHHGETGPRTVFDHIVQAANDLSAARPGARREQLASYVQRLEDLEKLASDVDGVSKVFALQAGREVRVMVENDRVDEAKARMLAKEIATRIEEQASYPGQVRVVVIREKRASSYAQ